MSTDGRTPSEPQDTAAILEELEAAAKAPNISRQAVIKTIIRQALDECRSVGSR